MDAINVLEYLLKNSGIEDWGGHILKLDGDVIYMCNAKEEKGNEETFQFNL